MTTTASSPSRPSSLPACGPHLPHQRLSRSRQTTNNPWLDCKLNHTMLPASNSLPRPAYDHDDHQISSSSRSIIGVKSDTANAGRQRNNFKEASSNKLISHRIARFSTPMLQPNSYLPPTQIHFTSAILSSSLKFGTHTCTHHHHHHHHRPHILTNKQN